MIIAEAVGGILDIFLYAQPAFGGAGACGAFVAGPLSVPTDAKGFDALYTTPFTRISLQGCLITSHWCRRL
jgi:hypothetical protein